MAMTAMAMEQGILMAANKRNATPIKPRRSKAEKPRRAAGAHSASTSLKDRLASWREHHRDSLRDALHRINLSRASSTMTILVIAIALSLPAGLAVLHAALGSADSAGLAVGRCRGSVTCPLGT